MIGLISIDINRTIKMKKDLQEKGLMISELDLVKYIREVSTRLEPLPAGIKPDIRKLPGIEAVIFDVYGTLFISGSGDISISSDLDYSSHFRKVIDKSGINIDKDSAPENIKEIFISEIRKEHISRKNEACPFPEVNVLEIWKRVFSEISSETESELDKKIPGFAVSYECSVNPVWPMKNAELTINYLKDREMITGIVSNAQFYTPLMFPAFFGKNLKELGFCEDLCIWSWEKLRGKPDIKLFLNLLTTLNECYNIKSSRTLYVGNDMLNDVWAAGECGIRTALFAGDKRSLRLRSGNELCGNTRPDCVITDLEQLRDIV